MFACGGEVKIMVKGLAGVRYLGCNKTKLLALSVTIKTVIIRATTKKCKPGKARNSRRPKPQLTDE